MIENDIKQQLAADNIDDPQNIILGAIPTTSDNVIVITTSDSILTSSLNTLANQALIPPGISDIQQTITITVRNTDYTNGHDKVWAVYNDLIGTESSYKVCNNRKMFIMAAQPPHFSKQEDSNFFFTFNFVVNTSRDN